MKVDIEIYIYIIEDVYGILHEKHGVILLL